MGKKDLWKVRRSFILFGVYFFFVSLPTLGETKMEIEIIPFGQIESAVLDHLKVNLTEVFKAQISIGETQASPEYAYNQKRGQYYSSLILRNLLKLKENKEKKILAIIDQDLYVLELNFVFGEADPLDNICLISITRLHQSYYGLAENEDLFLKRTLKEAVHELGHLLGLRHCLDPGCVMHFSNSLADTDRKDYRFCKNCRKFLS